MKSVECILNKLDWSNDVVVQKEGVALAKKMNDISPFLQPCTLKHNKNVWDNCALIVSECPDEVLSEHLIVLLEWLQDLNWPGAISIFNRLKRYNDKKALAESITICTQKARDAGDDVWLCNLQLII